MREVIGPRFVSVDLDVVICGDISHLWRREEDFIIWGSQIRNTPYNGSMWMMDAGAREQVYTEFHPDKSPVLAKKAGMMGTDQAWISYCLGKDEATWTRDDGVYAYRSDLKRRGYLLPSDACMVFFQGLVDPWSEEARHRAPWVLDHYH